MDNISKRRGNTGKDREASTPDNHQRLEEESSKAWRNGDDEDCEWLFLKQMSEMRSSQPKPGSIKEVHVWYKRTKRKLFAKGNENET